MLAVVVTGGSGICLRSSSRRESAAIRVLSELGAFVCAVGATHMSPPSQTIFALSISSCIFEPDTISPPSKTRFPPSQTILPPSHIKLPLSKIKLPPSNTRFPIGSSMEFPVGLALASLFLLVSVVGLSRGSFGLSSETILSGKELEANTSTGKVDPRCDVAWSADPYGKDGGGGVMFGGIEA